MLTLLACQRQSSPRNCEEGEGGALTGQTSLLDAPLWSLAVLDNLWHVLWTGETQAARLELVDVVLGASLALPGEQIRDLVLPSGSRFAP